MKNKTLDLHTCNYEDAERKIIRFIEDWWGTDEELEIITGNSKRMKAMVAELLDNYGVPFQVGRPFDVVNTGYITCNMQQKGTFMEAYFETPEGKSIPADPSTNVQVGDHVVMGTNDWIVTKIQHGIIQNSSTDIYHGYTEYILKCK